MNLVKESFLMTIGQALDNLGNSYQCFICADNKRDKLEMLNNIRLASLDVHKQSKSVLEELTGKLIGPDPNINIATSEAIAKTSINIHMQILNLDQLAKYFVMSNPEDKRSDQEQIQEKIQYLYQIYSLSAEIAEAALITNVEPD